MTLPSPSGRKPRLRIRGPDKYPLILKAARDLVAAHGFRDVQMSSIADAAGIAIGTLYRYFPAKSDLMIEVVSLTAQREVDVVASVAREQGTAAQRLGAAAWTFANRALRGRRMAYALVAEPVEPEIEAARLKYHRALAGVFTAIIEDGVRSGEFPRQNERGSAACIVGCLFEGLVNPLSTDSSSGEPGPTEHAIEIISFCLRGVSGGPLVFAAPQ
ncbi:TetR family transcriptional regulator [Duganella sp. CY42W]|uniref:TetR family transcriptional regulator n=1 Tax=Duganella levis TaxID=2692169 RepID=A0ABW9W3X8_9BURK|nr:TetR/AcrR family transcriptional regulator [Duganella levis]MYN28717.1 TetR family transcriptional regulator [Duganella levis]